MPGPDPVPVLPARAGTHATFLAAMIDRLAAADLDPLGRLTTRDPADPALALLDGWAVLGDVLTFYTERIGAEGYLGTATERRSLLELARLVGYQPRPGLAASTWLAYAVDPDPVTSPVTVPAGARVQSVPDPGGLPPNAAGTPQLFETSTPLVAHQAWNAMAARSRRPMLLTPVDAAGRTTVYLRGVGLGLATNDRLLFRFDALPAPPERAGAAAPAGGQAPPPVLRAVRAVTEDPAAGRTTVTLTDLTHADLGPGVFRDLFVLRVKAAPFGATAPLPPPPPTGPILLAAPGGEPAAPDGAEGADGADGADGVAPATATGPGDWPLDRSLYGADRHILPLDADHARIGEQTPVVIERPDLAPAVLTAKTADTVAIARYGISARVVRLHLDGAWLRDDEAGDRATLEPLRSITVHAQAEPLVPDDEPVPDPVGTPPGRLDLVGDVSDLPAGRRLVLTGTPADPAGAEQPPGEVLEVAAAHLTPAERAGAPPFTRVTLAADLVGRYRPGTVTVFGNAVPATQGESVQDPAVGSGDATQAGQAFTLRRAPLTFVAADTPTGARAELTVRVDGVRWHEVPEIVRSGPTEHVYQLTVGAAGEATVRFGDGRHGARLPTGQGNVSVDFRVGIGRGGNLGADRLTQPLTKPLGVTSVRNPLPTSGGTDPDDDDAIRGRASLAVATLDRVVGLSDYAAFALGFAGVGKAVAARIPFGGAEVVHVDVFGTSAPLQRADDVITRLAAALRELGDAGVEVEVEPCTLYRLAVGAEVGLGPDRTWSLVRPALVAALHRDLGPAARAIGRVVFAAQVIASLQSVPGVTSVRLTRLGRVREGDAGGIPAGPPPTWVPAAPARVRPDGTAIDAAELLVVGADRPDLIDLEERVTR
ncbi:MAG TPA: putative baseplate assembly protein [Kineosporiaceae bacterium]